MIPRYQNEEISDLFSDIYKFSTYLKVELAILKAMEGKKIPLGTSEKIAAKAKINLRRIREIERETKHDIIAFCTSITESLSPDLGKFFHFGVTSSDIIDTTLTLQIQAALDVIFPLYEELLDTLKNFSIKYKMTMTMGRSHGMYAEPMSFGQKFLGHYHEFFRRYQDLKHYYDHELTVQFSGSIGNYTIISPQIESRAADILKCRVEPTPTQVIPRDRIAKLITINALIASAIERIAVEIRHLHRSEVDELHEGFSKGQKGSSIMPHKKNPISAENLTGMARYLRSHLSIALENIVLWHERDISHSSTERMYLPDNLGILFYSIKRLNSTMKDLEIHEDKIEDRVAQNFTYLSSYYLHFLIERTSLSRDVLYALIQRSVFSAEKTQDLNDFYSSLQKELSNKKINLNIKTLNKAELKDLFLGSVEQFFDRAIATNSNLQKIDRSL